MPDLAPGVSRKGAQPTSERPGAREPRDLWVDEALRRSTKIRRAGFLLPVEYGFSGGVVVRGHGLLAFSSYIYSHAIPIYGTGIEGGFK